MNVTAKKKVWFFFSAKVIFISHNYERLTSLFYMRNIESYQNQVYLSARACGALAAGLDDVGRMMDGAGTCGRI